MAESIRNLFRCYHKNPMNIDTLAEIETLLETDFSTFQNSIDQIKQIDGFKDLLELRSSGDVLTELLIPKEEFDYMKYQDFRMWSPCIQLPYYEKSCSMSFKGYFGKEKIFCHSVDFLDQKKHILLEKRLGKKPSWEFQITDERDYEKRYHKIMYAFVQLFFSLYKLGYVINLNYFDDVFVDASTIKLKKAPIYVGIEGSEHSVYLLYLTVEKFKYIVKGEFSDRYLKALKGCISRTYISEDENLKYLDILDSIINIEEIQYNFDECEVVFGEVSVERKFNSSNIIDYIDDTLYKIEHGLKVDRKATLDKLKSLRRSYEFLPEGVSDIYTKLRKYLSKSSSSDEDVYGSDEFEKVKGFKNLFRERERKRQEVSAAYGDEDL